MNIASGSFRWCSAKESGCSKLASRHVVSLWLQRGARQRASSSTLTGLPGLISLTHDLPSSFALAGFPVHLADSQSARFSLGNAQPGHRTDEKTQNEIPNACLLYSCIYLVTEHSHIECSVCKSCHY